MVALDVNDRWNNPCIEYVVGDITDVDAVRKACQGMDCVWHNAAAVGPFHPLDLYDKVNHLGTINVINACKEAGVPKIVMSSSPSTRFDGSDVDGLTEDEMPSLPMPSYLQAYAASKAAGEKACTDACCDELMTVAIAPHQVYGPRDNLFLPNLLEAGASGLLRVFSSARTGHGMNRVCFTHVDNYCHALIIGEQALYRDSPALGKFYIVTDGDTHPKKEGYAHFWKVLDHIMMEMGFPSLFAKFKLPDWLLMPVAYICQAITWITGKQLKLNPFNVRVLTMHRWFKIGAAERDLHFAPIVTFDNGIEDTCEWFREHWLKDYKLRNPQNSEHWFTGIAKQSQRKIDIQAESSRKVDRGEKSSSDSTELSAKQKKKNTPRKRTKSATRKKSKPSPKYRRSTTLVDNLRDTDFADGTKPALRPRSRRSRNRN